ncbi:MAG: DUF3795 domain-containing protein [Candidatus Bathyarchaeota archaeon]|nr:DUF3795 domain-containing protein [Candidatus Bathyarchaeota archaeon]
MEFQLGCCGLNCNECPIFIATSNNDDSLRQKTLVEWSKLYADFLPKPLEPSDMNCTGCHSQNLFVGCISCSIRKCCGEKNLNNCGDCAEFDSCEMLNGFFSFGYQKAKENLECVRASR